MLVSVIPITYAVEVYVITQSTKEIDGWFYNSILQNLLHLLNVLIQKDIEKE